MKNRTWALAFPCPVWSWPVGVTRPRPLEDADRVYSTRSGPSLERLGTMTIRPKDKVCKHRSSGKFPIRSDVFPTRRRTRESSRRVSPGAFHDADTGGGRASHHPWAPSCRPSPTALVIAGDDVWESRCGRPMPHQHRTPQVPRRFPQRRGCDLYATIRAPVLVYISFSNLSETVLSRWPIKAHRSRFEKPVFPERIPTELFIWMSHTIWLVPICVPRFDQVRGSARHQIFRIQHPHGFSEQSD